jgi:hypothetical protein
MRKNTWMTWWRISRRVWGYARTVRGVPQSKSPRGGPSLRKSKREREREMWRRALAVWEGEGRVVVISPRPGTHLRVARADSPRLTSGRSGTPTRTDRYFIQNIQYRPKCHRPAWTVHAAPADSPPGTADSPAHYCRQSDQPFPFQLDIFRDKDMNMNLLGSLLMNQEGNLPYDAM